MQLVFKSASQPWGKHWAARDDWGCWEHLHGSGPAQPCGVLLVFLCGNFLRAETVVSSSAWEAYPACTSGHWVGVFLLRWLLRIFQGVLLAVICSSWRPKCCAVARIAAILHRGWRYQARHLDFGRMAQMSTM